MFEVNKNPSSSDLHKFGLAMLLGFGVLGALAWSIPAIHAGDGSLLAWAGSRAQITAIAMWCAGLLLVVVSFSPQSLASPVYVVWMTAAVKIGLVASTVMLTVLFLVLLPVFSIIIRFGDPLRKKLAPGASYWEAYKDYEPTLERMQRPF